MKTPVKSLTQSQLVEALKNEGLPSFRSKQLISWLYLKGVSSYDEMTNLPKATRTALAEDYPLFNPTVIDKQVSQDGTRKYLLQFHDSIVAETVGIPSSDGRLTVCCSSQSGCPMGCDFCATGKNGFNRNLSCGEIVDQVLTVQKDFGQRVSNIVVMGQGEPFLNYDNTIEALRICNNSTLLNIGARKITISTCGILQGIEKLSSEPEQFTLAVSLHSAIQKTRDDIMPGVKTYPLPALKDAVAKYIEATNRRVTFEYALMRGVNDDKADFEALLSFCRGLLCHVNIIPLNEIEGSKYHPTTAAELSTWCDKLNEAGTEASIRNSRGSDIAGACGQLANRRTH